MQLKYLRAKSSETRTRNGKGKLKCHFIVMIDQMVMMTILICHHDNYLSS